MQDQENAVDIKLHWLHPLRFSYRFIILILSCIMTMGAYMAIDAPSAVASTLNREHGISHGDLGVLIAVYSLPNIILAFIGGIICSRIGYNAGSMLFVTLVLVGNIISAFGFTSSDDDVVFDVLLVGRFIFGSGSESLTVSQTIIIYHWFVGKELAFAYGLVLTLGRLGSIMAFWILPPVAASAGLQAAFWLVNIICIISVISTILMWILDVRGNRIIQQDKQLLENSQNDKYQKNDEIELSVPTQELSDSQKVVDLEEEEESQENSINLLEEQLPPLYSLPFKEFLKRTAYNIYHFPKAFWLLIIICCAFYGSALSFQSFSSDYFTDARGVSEQVAARITSIKTWSAMILSPILGIAVDYLGYRVHLLFSGVVALVPTFLLYTYSTIPVILLAIIIGFSFSLVPAVIWPSIPLVIKKETSDSAFGMSFSVYNFSLFLGPLIFGWLREIFGSWNPGFFFFSFVAFCGSVAAFLLFFEDKRKHENILKMPSPGVQFDFWKKIWKRLC